MKTLYQTGKLGRVIKDNYGLNFLGVTYARLSNFIKNVPASVHILIHSGRGGGNQE